MLKSFVGGREPFAEVFSCCDSFLGAYLSTYSDSFRGVFSWFSSAALALRVLQAPPSGIRLAPAGQGRSAVPLANSRVIFSGGGFFCWSIDKNIFWRDLAKEVFYERKKK